MQERSNVTRPKSAGQTPASAEQIAGLREIVDRVGAARAAREARLNPLTLMRVLAGLPVLKGTLALVDAALAKGKASPEGATDAA